MDYCYLCKKELPMSELVQVNVEGEVDLYCVVCGELVQHQGAMRSMKD